MTDHISGVNYFDPNQSFVEQQNIYGILNCKECDSKRLENISKIVKSKINEDKPIRRSPLDITSIFPKSNLINLFNISNSLKDNTLHFHNEVRTPRTQERIDLLPSFPRARDVLLKYNANIKNKNKFHHLVFLIQSKLISETEVQECIQQDDQGQYYFEFSFYNECDIDYIRKHLHVLLEKHGYIFNHAFKEDDVVKIKFTIGKLTNEDLPFS